MCFRGFCRSQSKFNEYQNRYFVAFVNEKGFVFLSACHVDATNSQNVSSGRKTRRFVSTEKLVAFSMSFSILVGRTILQQWWPTLSRMCLGLFPISLVSLETPMLLLPVGSSSRLSSLPVGMNCMPINWNSSRMARSSFT